MGDFIGNIVYLEEFFSNETVSIGGDANKPLYIFDKDRVFHIPIFQREIRWEKENIAT